MYVLIIGRGYPSDKYKLNGIFEFDQAKALQSNGFKIVFPAHRAECTDPAGSAAPAAHAPPPAAFPAAAGSAALTARTSPARVLLSSGEAVVPERLGWPVPPTCVHAPTLAGQGAPLRGTRHAFRQPQRWGARSTAGKIV